MASLLLLNKRRARPYPGARLPPNKTNRHTVIPDKPAKRFGRDPESTAVKQPPGSPGGSPEYIALQ